MKKTMLSKIIKLAAFTIAVFIVITSINVLNVKAADTVLSVYELLHSDSYDDVNTLSTTVTVKTNNIKVKKDNAAQTILPTKVVVNGVTLKKIKNYVISYQFYDDGWKDVERLTVPGTYRMCIQGVGEYSGVCTKRVYVYDAKQIVPVSSVKVTVNKVPYTGEPITSGVIKSVKYKKTTLTEGEDYTVTYLNNVDSGTGIVRITGREKLGFIGEKDVKFTITGGTSIAKAKVTGITSQTYDNGNVLTQDMSQVKITFKGRQLALGTDYVVSYYMNNKKPGTAKIVFTGKGCYNGKLTKTFKINKPKLNYGMLDEESTEIVELYTKKAVKPDVVIRYNGYQLIKGVDYTLSYKNNVKISDKAVITVKGKGNFTGSFKVNFRIADKIEEKEPEKKAITYDMVPEWSANIVEEYTGKAIEPKIELIDRECGGLTEDVDYTLSYRNNVEISDKAVIVVNGKGNYTGSINIYFKIVKTEEKEPEKKTLTYDMVPEWLREIVVEYTGEAVEPAIDIIDKTNADRAYGYLIKDVDYTVSYENNVEVSDAAVIVVTGKGDYEGSIKVYFKIIKTEKPEKTTLSYDMVPEWSAEIVMEYTGEAVEPEIELIDRANGYLTKNVDYTLSYENNVEVSDKAVIVVTGKGNYTGSIRVYFMIVEPEKTEESSTEEESGTEESSTEEESGTEESSTEEESGTEESSTEEEKPTKPIAFRICSCGYIMPVYTYGLSAEESETWGNHGAEHCYKGEDSNYNDISYEKAIKYGLIHENSDGTWAYN